MASIWIEERGKASRKLCGRLSTTAALEAYSESIRRWPGPKLDDGCYCLLWRPGDTMETPFAVLSLELMSPPSRPERGERRRAKADGDKKRRG